MKPHSTPKLVQIVRIAASLLAFLSVHLLNIDSFAESLSTRFRVPDSGHIELQRSAGVKVQGVNVESIDDVLDLYTKLGETKLDPASVKSWAFLKEANLTKVSRKSATPPPGAGKVTVLPEWRSMVVNFDGSKHAQTELSGNGGEQIIVISPESLVNIDRSTIHQQINHYWPGTSPYWATDAARLFSRSPSLVQENWTTEILGDEILYKRGFGGETPCLPIEFLLVRPSSDTILASAGAIGSKVHSFTLHFLLRPLKGKMQISVPMLTCEFHRAGGDDDLWHLDCYLFDVIEFNTPIDQTCFTVPLLPGQLYVAHDANGEADSMKSFPPIPNILELTPQEASQIAMTPPPTIQQTSRKPLDVPTYSIATAFGFIFVFLSLIAVSQKLERRRST